MTDAVESEAVGERGDEPITDKSKPQSWRSSLIFGIAFFAIYIWSCSSAVQGGDSGEFATVAALGGVPHPPGYPLFVILSQLTNMVVPFGSVAFKAAIASVSYTHLTLPTIYSV